MKLLEFIKKIAVAIEKKTDPETSMSIEWQKQYLEQFKEPKDDIERSYLQYKCQKKLNNPIFSFFLNLASFSLMLYYLLKSNDTVEKKDHYEGIFFSDGKPDNIIPEVLKNQVEGILRIDQKGEFLSKKERAVFGEVFKRYPFSWHFLLKILIKIRFYGYEIERCSPTHIIVCNEYSFTSSVMTYFCEQMGIEHINVMHGEKIFTIRDTFFRFHKCYVWDTHYQNLFIKMRAAAEQFVIAVPQSLSFASTASEHEKTVDYTYYLGWESGERLALIIGTMESLIQAGYRVAIRPHPRYSDMNEVNSLKTSELLTIENCRELTIEESVLSTRYAVSLYSTVLNQAYYNGVSVVIDDLSDPEKFEKLKKLDYIMLTKEHRVLSEVVRHNGK